MIAMRRIGLAATLIVLAAQPLHAAVATQRAPVKAAIRRAHAPALSRSTIDTTCAPCTDFNRYANGRWLDTHEIPATHSAWGSFSTLTERNQEILRDLLVKARSRASSAGADQKLGAYWCSCMDSTSTAGVKDVIALVTPAANVRERSPATPNRIAMLHDRGIGALFQFRSAQDPRNSDKQIAHVGQGGLGLPDRDYYLRTDSAAVATRARYVEHIAKLMALESGSATESMRASAQQVLELETAMAKASMTNVQRRDPVATYHKLPADSLFAMCPNFAWREYFDARGLLGLDSINVTQPDFVRALNGWIASPALGDYLRFSALHDAAPMLGPEFAKEDFEFNRVLTGAQIQLPRWKRCVRWADRDLGDLLGKAYVKDHFPPAARASALELVHDLEAALDDRIQTLEWMGPETRTRALAKLHAFEERIGYADRWRDYTGVTIGCAKDQSLVGNHYAAAAWEAKRNMAKIGKPVDRGEWSMTPQTVNAFYSGSLNSINFPAGILQPPFFEPAWDDAVNYGAIGSVIGHEMTHGFDDRGRQFDAKGNLSDWWTAEDAARYKERADQVANQYSAYTVLDTLHLNGRLTLGENIADLGGVAVAYHAFEKALARRPAKKIDGFTPQQRFFLAYARLWCTKQRPAALRTMVQTNPHSPQMWRANGPLTNLREFQQAWGCKEGDPMVRPAALRARIW